MVTDLHAALTIDQSYLPQTDPNSTIDQIIKMGITRTIVKTDIRKVITEAPQIPDHTASDAFSHHGHNRTAVHRELLNSLLTTGSKKVRSQSTSWQM